MTQDKVPLAGLQFFAETTAKFLFLLRDGRPGKVFYVEEPMFEIRLSRSVLQRHSPSKIAAAMDNLKAAMQERNQRKKDKHGVWAIEPPVIPSPDLWEDLKEARSERAITAIAAKIAQWDQEQQLGYTQNPRSSELAKYDFIRALTTHARTIMEALQLPEYPKTERSKSDDKRVWFFAKVLAGLMCEQRPLYTLKRLSRWHGDGIFAETKRHVAPKVV